MKRRTAGLLALTAGGLALAGLLWPELPSWRPGGSLMLMHEPLGQVSTVPIDVPQDARILVLGDSNSRGERDAPRTAYPAVLQRQAGKRLQVSNLSRGGFTARDGLRRWDIPSGTSLCVIAFGTNDAAPRSWLQRKQPVPIGEYQRDLHAIAAKCRNAGAKLLFLAPFPTGTWAMEDRITPYRRAAREVAIEADAAFLDPVTAFAGVPASVPLLSYDALHLNGRAQALLGDWLYGKISVAGIPRR